MAKLPEERRQQLLVETRGAADALLGDLSFLRGMVKNTAPSRHELRRCSALLRRIE